MLTTRGDRSDSSQCIKPVGLLGAHIGRCHTEEPAHIGPQAVTLEVQEVGEQPDHQEPQDPADSQEPQDPSPED